MKSCLITALVAAALWSGNAVGHKSLIRLSGELEDMAYDAQMHTIYVTGGLTHQIYRYDVRSGTMLDPIVLPGSVLTGIDVSPNGRTLAVTDATFTKDRRVLHLIDTTTLVDKPAVFATVNGDGGTFSVVYAHDGDIVVSENLDYPGQSPTATIRHYSAASKTWSLIGNPRGEFYGHDWLSASGDGSVVAFEDTETGPYYYGWWGTFNDLTGVLVHRNGYTNGTRLPNDAIAANAHGDQFVIDHNQVYDGSYQHVGTIDVASIGMVYDPVRPLGYVSDFNDNNIDIFDMNTIQEIGSIAIRTPFSLTGGTNWGEGRLRISRDGSLLMAIIAQGVYYHRLYQPLAAANVTASTIAGTPVPIEVSATLGIPGDFVFSIPGEPAHGTATVSGNTVVYTPDSNFSGTETFIYQAHYSQAVTHGTITVQVAPFVDRPPVARNDTIVLHQHPAPVLLDVLANDSDPDGQALSIVSATKPAQGKVAIHGSEILYTPDSATVRNDRFTCTVSDGHGGTASAVVQVKFALD